MIQRLALFLLVPLAVFADHSIDPLRPAMEKAVARVKPSLVRIQVVWVDYHQGREVKNQASGSGFIIHKRGYVVTNHHVAGRAARALCIFSNNEEIEATLVGTDPMTDIAVLKLDNSKYAEFPTVEWGDSSALTVGDTVLAMGSPLSLSQSVTRGIVSNDKMVMPAAQRRQGGFSLEGENVGSLVRWIAHDAPIYPGNSGGPLINLKGQVIGVNEISFGLGGAIPSNLARTVADQLIAKGQVSRSWLGLEMQPLLKVSGQKRGVLVSGVAPNSPAAKAGFQPEDILVRIDGKDITVRFDEELPLLNQAVASIPVGKQVEAVVERGDKSLTLKVQTAEREAAIFKQTELKQWGLTAKNISLMIAREMRVTDRNGVLVTSVRTGGGAGEAKPSLEPGDIILKVNGKAIRDVSELVNLTRELTAGQTKPVPATVEFKRRTEQLLTVVKVGIRELEDPGLEARKAWLPVLFQVITREMAEKLGNNSLTGVRVTQVFKNSTAEAAGLKVGDLIVEVDGEKIQASQPGDEEVFSNRIRQYRVGTKVELRVIRGTDAPQTIAVELVRSPQLEREMKKFLDNNFEFTARDLSFFDRVRHELAADAPGALVTEVKDGGWAALGELQPNDVIQTINNETVADVTALGAKMKAISQDKPKFVVLRVLRGVRSRYLELEPNWENGK